MYPAIAKLDGIKVVLASKSPRRLHIFKAMGIAVEQRASSFAEDLPKDCAPHEYAMSTAKGKNESIEISSEGSFLLVAADTIAVMNGKIYEKPANRPEAIEILKTLSSNWIDIITGVNVKLIQNGGLVKEVAFHETTRVKLRDLTQGIIDAYLDTGAGMDHCGALALHDEAMILVERYDGDYYNAIGFPMHAFYRQLEIL